jgi:DNA-binding LacI/PurR family transcriptional regulator
MVLVDEPSGGDLDAYSRVNVDDRAGGRAAAAHLVALGHRRIAVFTVGPPIRRAATGSCRGNGCAAGAPPLLPTELVVRGTTAPPGPA